MTIPICIFIVGCICITICDSTFDAFHLPPSCSQYISLGALVFSSIPPLPCLLPISPLPGFPHQEVVHRLGRANGKVQKCFHLKCISRPDWVSCNLPEYSDAAFAISMSFVTVLQEVVGHKMCTFCFHKGQKICPRVPSEKSPQKLPQKKISPKLSLQNLPKLPQKKSSPQFPPKKSVPKLPLKKFALLVEFYPIFSYQPTR